MPRPANNQVGPKTLLAVLVIVGRFDLSLKLFYRRWSLSDNLQNASKFPSGVIAAQGTVCKFAPPLAERNR
eukprot:4362463-Amphidinium_carterae.1